MLRVIESPGRRISRVVIPHSPGGASKSSRGRGCRRTLGGPMPAADADLTLMIREGQKLGPAKDHRIVPGWHVTRTPSSGPSKSSSPKSGVPAGGLYHTRGGALARRACAWRSLTLVNIERQAHARQTDRDGRAHRRRQAPMHVERLEEDGGDLPRGGAGVP